MKELQAKQVLVGFFLLLAGVGFTMSDDLPSPTSTIDAAAGQRVNNGSNYVINMSFDSFHKL